MLREVVENINEKKSDFSYNKVDYALTTKGNKVSVSSYGKNDYVIHDNSDSDSAFVGDAEKVIQMANVLYQKTLTHDDLKLLGR